MSEEPLNGLAVKHVRKPAHPKQPVSYIPDRHLVDFAAIDFEAANGKITSACSVGVVIVHEMEIVDRFYSLIKPVPNYYDFYNSKVNGLHKADTDKAPDFAQVWSQVADRVEGLPFVAHGMLFDQRCLKALHAYYHIKYPNYPFYCTHVGATTLVPGLDNYKLKTVALHFGYDLTHKHHALADAEACAVIAMHIF